MFFSDHLRAEHILRRPGSTDYGYAQVKLPVPFKLIDGSNVHLLGWEYIRQLRVNLEGYRRAQWGEAHFRPQIYRGPFHSENVIGQVEDIYLRDGHYWMALKFQLSRCNWPLIDMDFVLGVLDRPDGLTIEYVSAYVDVVTAILREKSHQRVQKWLDRRYGSPASDPLRHAVQQELFLHWSPSLFKK